MTPPASRSREPRIVFDARIVTHRPTGLGRYATQLLQSFATHRWPVELTVLVHSKLAADHPLRAIEDGATPIRIIEVPVPGVHPVQHLAIGHTLRRLDYDLYHYPHYDVPWSARGRIVLTIHDLKFWRFPELMQNRARAFYMRATMARAVRRAARILTVSRATRDDLAELLDVATTQVDVAHLAAGVGVLANAPTMTAGYFLFVGERRPHKNIVRLLQAYARLRARGIDLPALVIAGRAYPGDHLAEATCSALGLDDCVRWVSDADDRALATLYAGAGALVLPSLYEGFGIPLLEAMQAGLPVITSNISSMPEVAGNAALLVDPRSVASIAEAMGKLATDRALAETLKARGLERAAQFTWRRTAMLTVACYHRVLGLQVAGESTAERPAA